MVPVTGPTTRHQQALYLDHEKAQLLDELSAETRIAKAVLLREAVDDLPVKHGKLKATPRKKSPGR
jgi:predicted DNA-binding protein